MLSLPVYTQLQFGRIANLTYSTLYQAKKVVAAAEKSDFMRYWLTQSALWTAVLEKWDAEKKAATDERYLEAISADSFNAMVEKELTERGIPVGDADAQGGVSKRLAEKLFYEQRYQLTWEFLAERQALSLLKPFNGLNS